MKPTTRTRRRAAGVTPRRWSTEERAILDALRVRAGVSTDDAVIALALYRLAAWYEVWPSSTAFVIGPVGPVRRRA